VHNLKIFRFSKILKVKIWVERAGVACEGNPINSFRVGGIWVLKIENKKSIVIVMH
jgi:hypothetical protein